MQVLEIGVGGGANLASLYPPDVELVGVEPDPVLAERARQRGVAPVFVGGLPKLPPQLNGRLFDLICLFDVLEHIAEERDALSAIRDRLTPEGQLALTVPAYQWMWGRQDVVSHHFRRYTANRLRHALNACGFDIGHMTYFNTLLFPPIAALRVLARMAPGLARGKSSDLEAFTGTRLNLLLHWVFALESRWLVRSSLPYGVSLFAISRRTSLRTGVRELP